MKILFQILIVLFAISGGTIMAQTTKLVTPKVFKEKMNAEQGEFQIVDLRTPKEFKKGHLENAININFYSKDFKEQLNKLNKEMTTYVYCHSAGRSARSMSAFKSLGFKEVYDMDKGYVGWVKEKYKTVKK